MARWSNPKGGKRNESGHPLQHVFTRAIPDRAVHELPYAPAQYLPQFSYLGYTMWDYESRRAVQLWPGPEKTAPRARTASPTKTMPPPTSTQRYPTAKPKRCAKPYDRNPEGRRPAWACGAIVDFLRNVYDREPFELEHTQFADYHSHGWNFRAILKP